MTVDVAIIVDVDVDVDVDGKVEVEVDVGVPFDADTGGTVLLLFVLNFFDCMGGELSFSFRFSVEQGIVGCLG